MNKALDKLGICASGICLIHCLLTPILVLSFPILRTSEEAHELIHLVIGFIVITSVLVAVYPHCNRHGHKDIVAFAVVGTLTILFALFFGHSFGHLIETIFTVLGSILLIIAHIKNMKVRHGKCESDCK